MIMTDAVVRYGQFLYRHRDLKLMRVKEILEDDYLVKFKGGKNFHKLIPFKDKTKEYVERCNQNMTLGYKTLKLLVDFGDEVCLKSSEDIIEVQRITSMLCEIEEDFYVKEKPVKKAKRGTKKRARR